MNFEALLPKIIAAGVPDATIFIHHMPHDVPEGVLLLEGIGGTEIDPYLPKFRDTKFQVVVRSKYYDDAQALAQSISDVLDFSGEQLSGVFVKLIRPLHEPLVFPSSKGDHLEASVNFHAVYVITS